MMSVSTLSPDLRRFILAKLHSVPVLEALLLLRSGGSDWSTTELAARLYMPETQVLAVLRELERQQLARFEADRAVYAPLPEFAAQVDELAGVYSRRVVEVAQLIHSSTERKAQNFADAFLIRRDK